eukprot:s638_g25.t2
MAHGKTCYGYTPSSDRPERDTRGSNGGITSSDNVLLPWTPPGSTWWRFSPIPVGQFTPSPTAPVALELKGPDGVGIVPIPVPAPAPSRPTMFDAINAAKGVMPKPPGFGPPGCGDGGCEGGFDGGFGCDGGYDGSFDAGCGSCGSSGCGCGGCGGCGDYGGCGGCDGSCGAPCGGCCGGCGGCGYGGWGPGGCFQLYLG